jgi:hypothetical protein
MILDHGPLLLVQQPGTGLDIVGERAGQFPHRPKLALERTLHHEYPILEKMLLGRMAAGDELVA